MNDRSLEGRRYPGEIPSTGDRAVGSVTSGGNDERVAADDVATMLADFLAWSQLPDTKRKVPAKRPDFSFNSNSAFWKSAGQLYEGATVVLDRFAVMEWAPAAPGRYFTPEAAQARNRAADYISASDPEYLPLGKMDMVLGGVGSVRLASIPGGRTRSHFLGATSSGVSHTGIPLCVGHDIYRAVIPLLKENGACDCRITGEIELLPDLPEAFDFDVSIPRYILHAKDIEILNAVSQHSTRVSLSVLFLGAARSYERERKAPRNIGWSFANFDPCDKSNGRSLQGAIDWLNQYAARHSVYDTPHIVCDFDQHVRHFENAALFRIEDIIKGEIDIDLLRRFTRGQNLTINISQIGDRFENIVNSSIINRSIVFGGESG